MQHDAMDDGPDQRRRTSPRPSRAAAALFHAPSGDLAERLPAADHLLPVRSPRCPAACPCGSTAGSSAGLGVGGPAPFRCAELAAAVLAERAMTVRVCVVGCGAIGSLYAAHLARLDDVEVWAVDPCAAHVDAITSADGLRVTGRAPTSTADRPRRATTTAADVPPCDFGIVATKAEHTRAAVAACAGVFADAAVASVQNGLGNEEVVAELVPPGHPRHDPARRRGHGAGRRPLRRPG